jgi:cell pole-organizing protein PopZ
MALLQSDGSVRTVNPVVTVKANGSAANDPLAEIKAQLAALAHQNQQLTAQLAAAQQAAAKPKAEPVLTDTLKSNGG